MSLFKKNETEIKHTPPSMTAVESKKLKELAEKILEERKEIVNEYKERKHSKVLWFTRTLAFAAFGTTLFHNPYKPLNLFNIGFGVVICLFLNAYLKYFYRFLLTLFNPKLKKEVTKKAIHHSVNRALIYIVPYAAASLVGTFYFNWEISSVLLSTAIVTIGISAAGEISRLAGKSNFKNTVLTSIVSYSTTFLLTHYIKTLVIGPGLIETLVKILPTLLGKGGN